jgi:hypothetical protein
MRCQAFVVLAAELDDSLAVVLDALESLAVALGNEQHSRVNEIERVA